MNEVRRLHAGLVLVCALLAGCAVEAGDDNADDGAAATAGTTAPPPNATAASGTGGVGAAGMASTAGAAGAAGTSTAGAAGSAGTDTATSGAGGESGAPQAGSAGESGMGGAAGEMPVAGDGSVPDPAVKPPCVDDVADLVILGDSYVDWVTHTFLTDLRGLSGREWPSYAVGGASMATGGISGFIPDQFTQAIMANPNVKAIVMTGGGNDILIPDAVMFPGSGECTVSTESASLPDCQMIVQRAADRAREMISEAADAGIEDVIYFFYPEIPGGGIIGQNPNYILHYALPRAKQVCDDAEVESEGRLRCHFIDTIPIFAGKTGLFADAVSEAGDGIHPNGEGSKLIAAEVHRVMQEQCIGQPSSSACCEP